MTRSAGALRHETTSRRFPMGSHKFWAVAALVCMICAMYTGAKRTD
ncbi:hypothetical protein HMPREF0762_00792 [Slackia exigua ATCC 700122]|uniref:Uncharacterized protein n=1 Tax=Slackia exigua (strain ATCC 700122 / DSM 15923 / CIP 105133 / JCM 11022 / KCTC 5966 / S-7) TaxID=649764 RepID=D0WG41_SLAES|nr:hypothetical protein HMPREF0762_00792 [Slackia exigua ATCC 700122]